jgi:L-rhamnose mutarotase
MATSSENLQRVGQLLRVKPEARDEYIRYHQKVWPEVLKTIHDCNIRNYSIFLWDNLLFAYFEYIGQDYAADMAKMAADPKTQEWWAIMMPMQDPIPGRAEGDWWAKMPEVFHTE